VPTKGDSSDKVMMCHDLEKGSVGEDGNIVAEGSSIMRDVGGGTRQTVAHARDVERMCD
jgi:hypothetical protein